MSDGCCICQPDNPDASEEGCGQCDTDHWAHVLQGAVDSALERATRPVADDGDGWETTAAVLAYEVKRLRTELAVLATARCGLDDPADAFQMSSVDRQRSLARMLRDQAGVKIGLTGGQKRALRRGQRNRIAGLLAEHRPDQWNYGCTCGSMGSADWRTHRKQHEAHLAAVITSSVHGFR